jgi:hypothetical protein
MVRARTGVDFGSDTEGYVFTVIVNGSTVTTITCDIVNTSDSAFETQCSSSSTHVVVAGDTISLRAQEVGTANEVQVMWSVTLE